MSGIDADRVIQLQGQKLADAQLQHTMQVVYSEQLEKQIAQLQARVRELEGESVGMVNGPGGQEAPWHPDGVPAQV